MKKKFSSLIAAAFVLLMCVFASACGDRYKDLEFKVYYAFSEDAKTWHDASDGISLNYGLDDNGSEGESSLVFDDYGATIYLKVEVQNVKAKYIDKITVSPISTEGLDFSSVMVKQKQSFSLPIVGNVNTSLKFYENNSGKKYELPVVISRKLEKIEADASLKPAMPLTIDAYNYGSLSLLSLNNLKYYPLNQTNQVGVTYSIASIGGYKQNVDSGVHEFIMKYNADIAKEYVKVENGLIKIENGDFFGVDGYIIRVKATSIFYDGSVEGVEPIETYFDVYVVDSELPTPIVTFNNGNDVLDKINLYENGGEYATSSIVVDDSNLLSQNKVYTSGVLTNDGTASYGVAIYVLDKNGEYTKCDFTGQGVDDGIVGVNGLYIKKGDDRHYTLSIASREVANNKIKIAYELEGFDYSHSQGVDASREITVAKDVIPTNIIVNDTVTMKDGDVQYADIYSTSNVDYKGLQLKIVANPNNNLERRIEFEHNSNISVMNANGQVVSWVYSGETVNVKFTGDAASAELKIKTLNVPEYYNGASVSATSEDYLTVSYNLTKCVTADSFEFVADYRGTILVGDALVNANANDSVFVKVCYLGESLVASTVNLKSSNPKVLFGNGTSEMELSDAILRSTGSAASGRYDIYEIPVKAVGSKEISQITITAGDESFKISETVNVSSVFIMSADDEMINIDTQTMGVKEFTKAEVDNGAFNFAIARGETVQFVVKDGTGNTNTISKINIGVENVEGDDFSSELFNPTVISNSVFDVVSYTSGKTQVLKVSVSYYVVDDDITSGTYEQIISRTQNVYVEIAVFDSIGIITRTASNQSIGYVNKYYNEISSSEITFTSYTAGNGSPSNAVVFTEGLGGGTITTIDGASQIMVRFVAGDYQAITQSGVVDIYYVVNNTKTSLLNENGTILTNEDGSGILNGSFVIELRSLPTGLKDISLTLTALRFGIISNTSIGVTINIAEVDKAERIVVDGDFAQTSETSKELQMSFMDVADGGVDIAEFDTSLEFKTQTIPQGMLRFDDIDNSLTYVLYRYQLDANGQFKYDSNGNVKYSRIDNDFFDVSLENGKVTIKASKNRGGGLFKLVLATKDSYNQEVDPESIDLEEYHFDKTYELTIRVSDGTKNAAYIINNEDDLQAINYNLDKHFVINANLGEDEPVNIKPLGVVNVSGNNVVQPFTGSLNGQFTTVIGENQGKTTSYSIRLHIDETVVSTEGYLAGLFAIIGEEANISNLKLNVTYGSIFNSTDTFNGLKIGALAGINNGLINNIQVNIQQSADSTISFASTGVIYFGGIVGVNGGTISDSRSESYNTLNIVSGQYQTHNIGLIAGLNNTSGEIYGSYIGKESLNNYIYDVIANLKVENTNQLNDGNVVQYYVGAVAGTNYGLISGMLVGGQIYMSTSRDLAVQSGAIGGVAGLSDESSTIKLSTALSLNITSTSSAVDVGGIVGNAKTSTIDTVKYISAITSIDGVDVIGVLSGESFVGGVVANAEAGSINYASVESFVETFNEGDFYSIQNGTTTAGLAWVSGTNVDNSFVSANIKSTGAIYVTTNVATEENTYFIGKIDGTVSENNADYSIVNGNLYKEAIRQTLDLDTFMLPVVHGETNDWTNIYYTNDGENYVEATGFVSGIIYYYLIDVDNYKEIISINSTNTDWTNIYYLDGPNFVKADAFDNTKTYKKFDAEAWQEFAYGLVGLTTPELIETNTTWLVEKDYNVVKVNGVELFFPYLLREYKITLEGGGEETKYEPLQVVKPQTISAAINQNYVTSSDSVYVKEFNYSEYVPLVKETVVVNFFKDAGDELNAHNLFNDGSNNGLLDLSLLPYDAQGGYAYEIMGDGHNYAYINNKKQIVFTRASNQTPVLVRVYSAFNTEIEIYVAFYSQSLLTNLTLNSSSIYYANEPTHDYEINAYTGQNNKVMALNAENILAGNTYQDIFDIESLSQYLDITETSTNANSKLAINSSNSQSMTLRVRDDLDDDERIGADEFEIITFSLFLKAEYFGYYTFEQVQYPHVQNDVLIGTIRLKVNLYNSATSIDVDGSDAEITTSDDINLTVTLTTEYVKESLFSQTNTRIETVQVNRDGELYYDIEDSDSIRIKLEVVDGIEEAETLCEANGVEHFAELFIDNAQIVSSLYKSKDKKVLGYQYNVFLELKDDHFTRLINNNIKFNIVVYALSNSEVSNVNSPIEILLKPATLQTVRMENYVVQSLKMYTDYTDIVANKYIETSIIEPGGLGNVMMIYLEPSYSQVTSASIKTSSLYVPSLGRSVQVKFTQLALDHRTSEKGVFTTLSAGRGNSQVGDTLELNLISEIDRNGNDVYTGILLVRVHIEEPFVGLEASMTISLDVKTKSNPEGLTRTRDLLTSYLPGTEISYNEDRAISNGYLIQKGTSNNEVTLKIYGYQFNSNPNLEFVWELPAGSTTYTYVDADNKSKITDGTKEYLIGDYISYYLNKNINEIKYDEYYDSYTLKLMLNVAEDIPAPFRLSAELYLATKDGQLKTSPKDENTLVFYPTEYILNSVYIAGLTDSERKNIPINQQREIELRFTTDSEVNDLSATIYDKLLRYAQDYDNTNGYENFKLASLFSYYKNGGTITFADNNLYSEFEYDLVNGGQIAITGLEKFNSLIKFEVYYDYKFIEGEYTLVFGTQGKPLTTTFTLNITADNQATEVIVYSADDIYNSRTGEWLLVEGANYVLVNDIELEQVTPITTKIGSFDGNNRVISIKSFKVDDQTTEYGLFANIGTYTVEDPETEQQVEYQTILKNMIVDYSKFEGTLALNNNTNTSLTFGGLVATNDGGLIYNCDVMNLNATKDVAVDIIVASNADLTFGGLVGTNKGIITNSRVGRASYTKITATPTTESTAEIYAGGLTFAVFNREGAGDQVNQFAITAGGFVGENNGTIASSYLTNTNLNNYSTNETNNITAGFVGRNSGTISYSYAKADEKTITTANPYATGYAIENLGNGIVSGFVYNNTGTINNSYANIELKTNAAYVSGFVYNNIGTISESYAATTMNSGLVDSFAEQPFIGVNSKGDLLSNGTIENCYYLMRSATDNPYVDGNKDVAQALNEENFQNSEYLVGFAFVLSNSKAEREQGIWSYYTTTNKKLILPELMNANTVSHSYRYVVDSSAQEKVLRNAVSFAGGTANNPYIISNVDEFNKVFTENGTNRNLVGNVRFINNINFNDDETAILTRSNYTLGSTLSSTKTSVEGNGMTISGIYLDVGDAVVSKIGLFAEIQNAYVKNLNLKFATPKTDGQFSTTTAMYSGGLAGRIENSAIINIKLDGAHTTLTGSNFVGGVAGLIKGNSLVYGIETNLNVKASGTEGYLYYNEEDYNNLNIKLSSYYEYSNYLKHLSYAGGVAGVLDLTKRSNIEYNVQFIDVHGDQMSAKTFDGKPEANILAEYAGGVAGYASIETQSFKLRYFIGESESVRGDTAVGGLYGVALGGIVASQVAAEEDEQYIRDTAFGDYIKALYNQNANAQINTTNTGNLNLLEGYKYVGGLVGVGLNSNINSSYSKATIKSGEVVGGLVGLGVAGVINYSYAIPYINYYEGLKSVGGLIGAAYQISPRTPTRNSAISTYEALLKLKGVYNKTTDVQFTFSTLILDDNSEKFANLTDAKIDYICADYDAQDSACLSSNNNSSLMYVYAGTVPYKNAVVTNQTNSTNKSSIVALYRLYNVGDPDQTVAFQEVFSGWALIKYWSLNDEKYFPLLNNETVDNFIEIDHQNDLAFIRTNPSGKFKVVDDITIDATTANWIISGKFTGVLVGELENDSRRPTITIKGLTPKISNASAGFFEETHNATISNLSFVWESSSSVPAIITSEVDYLTMVSGLICKDENSLISNVEVRVGYGKDATKDNTYLLNGAKIGGFGGIVGYSTNTNLLGCNYVGQVKAKVENSTAEAVYVGGAVGYAQTNNTTGDSMVINNVLIGAAKEFSDEYAGVQYPITSFDITVSDGTTADVYIGASVGKAENVAIATNNIGGNNYADYYNKINLTVNLKDFKTNLYLGGVVGYAQEGLISSCETLTNINLVGTTEQTPTLRVGGLAGEYNLGNPSSTTGIAKCNSYALISTYLDDDNKLVTSQNTQTMLSTGVARLGGGATLKQCLFTGEMNTEGSNIGIVYAGGAVAKVESSTNFTVDLEEITSYADMIVGSVVTTKLYAGGLVGDANKLNVSYSSSLGKIVPITNDSAIDIYAGGLIGKVTEKTNANNSYTISSIVADSIADSAISNLNMGALIGAIPEDSTDENIKFTNVFYSSDYALFADENYLQDETPLGMNLSATTMIRNANWHADLKTENGVQYGIWTEINGTTRLPHLVALEEAMIKFGILTKPTGATTYDYVEGSAMRPIIIESNSNYIFASNKYNYYLLSLSEDKDSTPTLSGALNGILIGEDKSIDKTFRVGELSSYEKDGGEYTGIVPIVSKHSAISNLHVVLDSEISISSTELIGIIAGLNEGVIFNSSVQGNGIKFTGAGSVGLIAGLNKGMVSYSFSTAEVIVDEEIKLGGIVHTNEGKLLSNYFTGYIENGNSTAGIIVEVDGGYIYNNYMAGVVTNIVTNAFHACSSIQGSNNFIDSYSDLSYAHNEDRIEDVLKPVKTAELMSNNQNVEGNKFLTGEWHVTVVEKKFDFDSKTYGQNYNYPIYRFNKMDSNLLVDDVKDQLYTGTGGNSEYEIFDNKVDVNLRYSYIANNTQVGLTEIDTQYYHAFKIPHLGVLTAVHNLLSESRNYVLIYNVNGEYGEGNYSNWEAIGTTSVEINGFAYSDKGFNGVFVTNKYFGYSKVDTSIEGVKASDDYCIVQNLSGNGLFADINNAYIGSIKLGSFYNLTGSGALGTTITGNTTVNNVEFVSNTTIAGVDSGCYGGLFGEVSSTLTLGKVTTSSDNTTSNVRLLGFGDSTVGLIAANLSGTIEFIKDSESTYYAWFNGNKYAGGVVGEISGGTIIGNDNTITILKTDKSGEEIDMCTGVIGGVAGKGYTSIKPEESTDEELKGINGLKVKLQGNEFKINSFGGVVGEVTEKTDGVQINDIIISASSNVKFIGNQNENRYYGMLVGLQKAKVKATGIQIAVSSISVTSNSNANFDENADLTGVGTFVGVNIKATIDVQYTLSEINMNVNGVPNLGGYIGYMDTTGNINSTNFSNSSNDISLSISGTTNVGGLFGYLKGDITENTFNFDEEYDKLINNTDPYATITINGSINNNKYKNFGGLFGRWDGTNYSSQIIKNANTIIIGTEGEAYNVGGIAGKIQTSEISNLTNLGEIKDDESEYYSSILDEVNSSIEEEDKYISMCKLMNVGGIFGYAYYSDDAAIAITEVYNEADITGYQNVGGIVGYATNLSITNNNNNVQTYYDMSKIEATEDLTVLYYDANDNGRKDDGEYSLDEIFNSISGSLNTTSGNIFGVINVGGAVGYAGPKVIISGTVSLANVYGNTSVGGLVGLSNTATLTNNYIIGSTEENAIAGEVKGVYYNYIYLKDETERMNSFIPTSVGGLVGTTVDTTLTDNVLKGVNIVSTEERESTDPTNKFGGAVISTISNYMADLTIGASNDIKFAEFIKANETYNLDKKGKINYADITTGYGGLVGTLDASTLLKSDDNDRNIKNNYLLSINIKAQLGINVGTYYGGYKFNDKIQNNGEYIALITPELMGEINVDGAYNVGGIVGFIDGSASSFNLSNEDLIGNANINIQENQIGVYVGGLIGKTNANTIEGLSISSNKDVNITMHTNNCYYVGGLIGRAEVNAKATIEGNLGDWYVNTNETPNITDDDKFDIRNESDQIVSGDDRVNFGAFIGMLKVGKNESGLTVNVKGNHKMPFTINTIENINYYDGDSRFNSRKDDMGIALYAEAYYVNKDSFNIVGSKDETLYDNDGDTNPLNDNAQGWSKQYTGFKQLQRIIPSGISQDDGYNVADWDSIAVLFDAAKITHVGTIGNLGLWKDEDGNGINDNQYKTKNGNENLPKDYICFTVYEQADGQATLYSAMGIASLMKESDEYEVASEDDAKDPDIEKFYYDPYLEQYMSAGKVSVTDFDALVNAVNKGDYDALKGKIEDIPNKVLYVKKDSIYTTPRDITPTLSFDSLTNNWLYSFVISRQSPYYEYYIDANNSENQLQALSYFTWGNNGTWKTDYTSIGGSTGVSIQNDLQATDENGVTSGKVNHLIYFVSNYLDLNSDQETGAYGTSANNEGAYFIFDVIYENSSANDLSYQNIQKHDVLGLGTLNWVTEINTTTITDCSDVYLPSSGSIFEVCGLYTPNVYAAHELNSTVDWAGVAIKAFWLVYNIVTFGIPMGKAIGGSIKAGLKALKFAGKKIGKVALQAGKKHLLRYVRKVGIKKLVSGLGFALLSIFTLTFATSFAYDNAMSYQNFAQPMNLNFGYLTSTYSRNISYETDENGNVVLSQISDYLHIDDYGNVYYYYSNTRPADYHDKIYIGQKVENMEVIENYQAHGTTYDANVYWAKEIDLNRTYLLKNSNMDKDWPQYVTIVDAGDDGVVGSEDANKDNTESLEMLAKTTDDNWYLVAEKYIYKDGQYYINANAGELDRKHVNLGFTVQTYYDSASKKDMSYTTPNYITVGNKYYVHGQFVSENYSYGYNGVNKPIAEGGTQEYRYTDNNLIYNGNYSINGVTINPNSAVHNETEMKYIPVKNSVTSGFEGYDYFLTVYYTANGISDIKVGETELVKYATFTYVEDYNPAKDYSSLGTENVDYVIKNYKFAGDVQNNSGEIFKYEGKEYNLNVNRYSYNVETEDYYLDTIKGTHVKIGNDYIEITAANRYKRNPILQGVFKVDNTAFTPSGTETDLTSTAQTLTTDSKITVAVYPSTFVNPYKTAPTGAEDSTYTWKYTLEDTNCISFAPTYYIYEGGYVTDSESIIINNGAIQGYPLVYTPMDESDYMYEVSESVYNSINDVNMTYYNGEKYYAYRRRIEVQKYTYSEENGIELVGTSEIISFKQLIDKWTDYKDDYSVTDEQPISDIYQVVDGIIYSANTLYTLDENGLLCQLSLKPFNQGVGNIYENRYLTNADVKLYTRYKYTSSNNTLDFSPDYEGKAGVWDQYQLIPFGDGVVIINNGQATRLVESARVILSGGNDIKLSTEKNSKTVSSGIINID